MTAPLLEVCDLQVFYGPLQVLFGVDLSVPKGTSVALLGTNGAGKSTVLRAVAGLIPIRQGQILLDGDDISALPAPDRPRAGVVLMEGGRAICASLSVREHLQLGAFPFLRDRPRVRRRTEEVLEKFPALVPLLNRSAGSLSGGEQQQVAMAKALLPEPRLLLIDELSLGLAPIVMQVLLAAVEDLVSTGTTILLVEQSLNIAMSVTQTAYFMEKGEVRFTGATADLLERGDLVRSVFFGAEKIDA